MIKLISTTTYAPIITVEWVVKDKAAVRSGIPSSNYNRTMPMRNQEAVGFWTLLSDLEARPDGPRSITVHRWRLSVA